MHQPPYPCSLENEEWDFIYNALITMKSGIEAKDAKSRKLRTEIGMARMLIADEIKGWNGSGTIDLSFLVGTLKTIRRLEKEFESCGIKKTEFLIFLELLVKKFEKQKLRVKKPIVMLSEFKKMKRVMESDSLRNTDKD
ncbi:hypothetical protein JXA56_05640 [Candidatus Micrarchaeota archaeon]|nr:hypothetical protein [Candidatus Micrarchaeota archaeon]